MRNEACYDQCDTLDFDTEDDAIICYSNCWEDEVEEQVANWFPPN